ncbi:MAG: FAD-dependent oxidoreductase [Chromatiales bacterium]|nr:FAD-dependent oxidoreductase [Chromatiales bacterium]
MSRSRWLLLALILAAFAAFFWFDLGRYLSLDYFKTQHAAVETYRQAHPWLTAGIYFLVYVIVTGLSLPGATVMSLAGAAIFGLLWGTVIISFASSIGATLAFLASRFLLRDWVQKRFGERLKTINAGIAKDGGFYLFTLRLVPLFPFFLINLTMGLTPIRTWTFYWVSQLGMLAGTIVYVNAGTQLANIESLGGILSPGLLASFALLGVFPLVARKLIEWLQARRVYAGFERPQRFDRNLIVIGAGSAGLVSAYIAAAVRAKVTLVEKHRMGGDCLNTGCVPSKTLIQAARQATSARRATGYGVKTAVEVDFTAVMARVKSVIRKIEPHDSVERYTDLGVEVVQGEARITDPWRVKIRAANGEQRTLSARSIVVAAGAHPSAPPIPGLDEVGYITSDTLWELSELPTRLLVLGGGPIGVEMAQAFARLGSRVTVVEMLPRLLVREDKEVSSLIEHQFSSEGIEILTGYRAQAFTRDTADKILIAQSEEGERRIPFDTLLVAVGRSANLSGYGLEDLGIDTNRPLEVNAFLQTRFPNIYAAGDIIGPFPFTHVAAHQAWYASVNALFDPFKKFRADYSVIPWATFTEPEVARVGLNEQEAKEQGIEYEVTRYGLDDLDRAIADGVAQGFVKVLTPPGKDRILGVTLVGEHAADLLAEWVLAMRHGIGLNKILGTIHIYPTLAEANKYTAGQWKRAHAPERLLAWVERFHAWRRG